MMSDYKVELVDESTNNMYVIFHGPPDSPYAGGTWRVHVQLPDGYPYKSPSIGFCNRMFHPNVDEMYAPPSRPSLPLSRCAAPPRVIRSPCARSPQRTSAPSYGGVCVRACVYASQVGDGVSRRDQSDVEPYVRSAQRLRSLSSTASAVSGRSHESL
jgi:hypothetical protein